MVLPEPVARTVVDATRSILDDFNVGGRLQHIRQFIWRGGHLQLQVDRPFGRDVLDVAYTLTARWPAAVLERGRDEAHTDLVPRSRAVVDGRWVRGSRGYALRVGIDLAVPSAIYIRAHGFSTYVPFLARPRVQVEETLNLELTGYVNAFLSRYPTVPQATATEEQRLQGLGLAAA
jgi:hypothetical protein